MKLSELCEAEQKKVKPPKPRPPKDLWFTDKNLWHMDLRREYGGLFDLLTDESEEETDVYATDQGRKHCYGVWRKDLGRGVTFAKSRPLNVISHRRERLGTFLTGMHVDNRK